MEEATPSNSITRKRKGRSQNEDCEADNRLEISNGDSSDECLSLEDSLVFNDTLIALQMMRAQFPKIDKVSLQPFILRSQLYSCILDRTQVDRDLESLRRERVLRIFKLNTGQDDDGIMFLDDYINQIDHVVTNLENKKQDLAVFDCFKTHVIMSKLEPNIRHQELCSLLSSGGKTRQLIDPEMYWFAIPNVGSTLKGISQGRKELLSFLNRRKYKEMMLAPLEKKRLRLSPLDMRFHLRDLIGSGQLNTAQTPSGLVVRVSKDGYS